MLQFILNLILILFLLVFSGLICFDFYNRFTPLYAASNKIPCRFKAPIIGNLWDIMGYGPGIS